MTTYPEHHIDPRQDLTDDQVAWDLLRHGELAGSWVHLMAPGAVSHQARVRAAWRS